ncbi:MULTISPECIES: hypothetical protein [Amycolatopsis]|uniref:Uncharacterized protein n=1 Tax=Amycolatopsis bullii TaxID=941987 RepID=A0ABQ3K6D9_9PSEU|nr:hypothetical protein [Amycolatopsis bullii]GHG05364.1 hypothetical protein GCM10017567_21900 [Amycolatopsis bullii]
MTAAAEVDPPVAAPADQAPSEGAKPEPENPTVLTNNGIYANHLYTAGKPDEDEDVKTGLVYGPISDSLVEQAVGPFCAPSGYGQASRILAEHRLVLLCGRSSGRSLAGVRLLIDANLHELKRLDPTRSARELLDLRRTEHSGGYLWDDVNAEAWCGELDTHVLGQLAHALVELDSYLVVTFANEDIDLERARPYVAELAPADPADMVRAHLRASGYDTGLLKMLDQEADLKDCSPWRACEIARLLGAMDDGRFSEDDVKAAIRRRGDEDVAAWFTDNTDIPARALAITVALMEGSGFNVVAASAKKLEDLLSNPENDELWPYLPPDLFAETRAERLRRIRALLEPPETWQQTDPEPVRFCRPGWGERLLAYVWKEYERIRPILQSWMGDLNDELPRMSARHDEAMSRFGRMLAKAAEPNPFGWVRPWVDGTRFQQSMAALILSGLCENSVYVQGTKNRVNSWSRHWVDEGTRFTAALVCRNTFGRNHPEFALAQLRKLTRNCEDFLQREIVRSLKSMLGEPSNRGLVLSTLPVWILHGGATQQKIATRCAVHALSLEGSTPLQFGDQEALAVRILFTVLLEDARHREVVLFALTTWAIRAGTRPTLRRDVGRVLKLLLGAPDEILVKRFAYFLRKYFEENRKATAPLSALTAEVLRELPDA